MATLHEAQEDYINRWKKNAEQHFKDGDYNWVASLVGESGEQRILEIGCEVGYSTLAFANRGIQLDGGSDKQLYWGARLYEP